MRVRLYTKRKGIHDVVVGWHMTENDDNLIPTDCGIDEGRGSLTIRGSRLLNSVAFGQTFGFDSSILKRVFLDENSLRGGDEVHGVVSAMFDDGSFIRYESFIDTSNPVEGHQDDTVFILTIYPEGPTGTRKYKRVTRFFNDRSRRSVITEEAVGVKNAKFALREETDNTPISAADISGDIEFNDITIQIDASKIFPLAPEEDEVKMHIFELEDLPVSTKVFADNLQNFRVFDNTIIQMDNTTLTGRNIMVADIDRSLPLALDRANDTDMFGIL